MPAGPAALPAAPGAMPAGLCQQGYASKARGYASRASSFALFELTKSLVKFTGGEGLFVLLLRGSVCGSCMASEVHDCFYEVIINLATADLRVLLNECQVGTFRKHAAEI